MITLSPQLSPFTSFTWLMIGITMATGFILAALIVYLGLPANLDLLQRQRSDPRDVWLLTVAMFSVESSHYQDIFKRVSSGELAIKNYDSFLSCFLCGKM